MKTANLKNLKIRNAGLAEKPEKKRVEVLNCTKSKIEINI